MYDRIEVELKAVHKDLYSNGKVSTASFSSGGLEAGDEPAQLCILVDAT
jgi:hypothetical protein